MVGKTEENLEAKMAETISNVKLLGDVKSPAQRLGAIQNSLGILSPDLKKINPMILRKVTGLGPSSLGKLTKIPRPMLYRDEITVPTRLVEKVKKLVMVTDLAFEILGNDSEETAKWLMRPNTILFGASPFEVCLRGEADHLIEWLNQRLGKTPGAAF